MPEHEDSEEGRAAARGGPDQAEQDSSNDPEESRVEAALEPRRVFNPRDDRVKIFEWLNKGQLDAKGLQKCAPHTAEDLREGNVTPADLHICFGHLLDYTLKVRLLQVVGIDDEAPCLKFVALRMLRESIPESWCRNQFQTEWLGGASSEFVRDLEKQIHSNIMYDEINNNDQHAVFVYASWRALKQTCEAWSQRVDDVLFPRQRSGTFLFRCKPYKMPQNEFEDWFENRIMVLVDRTKLDEDRQTIKYKKSSLFTAACAISEGTLDTLKTCWECNASESPSDLQKCSKCRVALYCSRDCQVSAWRSGHKTKCTLLVEKHAALVESLDTIDKAHQAGTMIHEFPLNAKADYELASGMLLYEIKMTLCPLEFDCGPLFDEFFKDSSNGPTMKIFYKNLGRVAEGDFWFDQHTESLDVYKSKLSPGSEEKENRQFLLLSFYLCFDYFASCEAFGATDAATVHETFSDLFRPLMESALGMPADRFVELYTSHKQFEDLDNRRTRRREKQRLLKTFRDLFHK